MKRLTVPLVGAVMWAGLACSPTHHPDTTNTRSRPTVTTTTKRSGPVHRPAPAHRARRARPIRSAQTPAARHAARIAARALAIFARFKNRVRIGMRSAAVARALASSTWLKHTHLYGVYRLGGKVPVNIAAPNSTVFCLHLYPNSKGWSPYVVYFRLDGRSGLTQKQGSAFLGGTLANPAVRLAEFALYYPPSRRHRHGHFVRYPTKRPPPPSPHTRRHSVVKPLPGTGYLTVTARTSGKVYLNGRLLGHTPLSGLKVPTGRYLITLVTAAGRRQRMRILVYRGMDTRVKFSR